MRNIVGSSFVAATAVCAWTIAVAVAASAFAPTLTRSFSRRVLGVSTATWPLLYRKNATSMDFTLKHRFERTAPRIQHVDKPCIIAIDGVRYNMTSWARAHPGGEAILQKFHNKDATLAFQKAHHSDAAVAMLQDFAIADNLDTVLDKNRGDPAMTSSQVHDSGRPQTAVRSALSVKTGKPRWRVKLFTKEDPFGVHKYLGVFVLLHFAFRFYQMLFTDPSAGLGTRLGRGPSWIALACLLPHGLLSLSSLIFHTVPRHRVVGKPMIWQEYRVHNIVFGLRSVVTAAVCSLAVRSGNTPSVRRWAVRISGATCILALIAADIGTRMLRSSHQESTTATTPYWEGCSVSTQKKFKSFYAYCQFLATVGCLMVSNPAIPLAILLPIQIASLLLTLVRKNLLSTRGFHLCYTASLIVPYIVAFRSSICSRSLDFVYLFALGGILYQLRRRGVNKYALWLPVILARVTVGDRYVSYAGW